MDIGYLFEDAKIIIGWIADQPLVIFFKWVLIIYCVVLFIDIILLLWVHGLSDDARQNRHGTSERPLKSEKALRKEWKAFLARLKKSDPNEWKLAILEADQFVDRVLTEMGYAGANLQERLDEMARASSDGVDKAIEAHRIRNRIIFEPDWHPTREEAERTLNLFWDFLDYWEIV